MCSPAPTFPRNWTSRYIVHIWWLRFTWLTVAKPNKVYLINKFTMLSLRAIYFFVYWKKFYDDFL